EVLEQRHVLLRKRSYLLAVDGDNAEYHFVPDKRHLQRSSRAAQIDKRPALRIARDVCLFGSEVDILNGRPFSLEETIWRGVWPGDQTRVAQIGGIGRRYATERFGNVTAAFKNPQASECRFAEPHRSSKHRIKYRCELSGRRIDDL